ncbi:hypothetical protein [Xanthomonas sp. NCPPB 2632]|jgi:Ca2+/H+ antiporter|uniref:hypothetical protein n=1 Tax=Xanthomonas sp. NCPPB 2632 TaxID=3240912 RepID=UPI003511434D
MSQRHLILAAWLALAVVSYVAGSVTGTLLLVGAGVVTETLLWFNLMQQRRMQRVRVVARRR